MPRDKKPYTAKQIKDVGESLRVTGEKLMAFADGLQKAKFKGEIQVEGGLRVVAAVRQSHTWLHNLQMEYERMQLPYQGDE